VEQEALEAYQESSLRAGVTRYDFLHGRFTRRGSSSVADTLRARLIGFPNASSIPSPLP